MEHRIAHIGTVRGMAAPYGDWAHLGPVRERIDQGAFDGILAAKQDVAMRWAHDPEHPLGRVANRTLRLWSNDRGLMFEVGLPDTQTGRDLKVLVERGEIGASIGFTRQGSVILEGDDSQVLQAVDLKEISLTANPAYKSTYAELYDPQPGDTDKMQWLSDNA